MLTILGSLLSVSCHAPPPEPCKHAAYAGRHRFDPEFEDAYGELLGHVGPSLARIEARIGTLDPEWSLDVVAVDRRPGQPGYTAETYALDHCKLARITFTSDVLAAGTSEATLDTLSHELAHAVALSRLQGAEAPRWLIEGLAVWASNQVSTEARLHLGSFLRKPEQLPDPGAWALPDQSSRLSKLDYFMAGMLVTRAAEASGRESWGAGALEAMAGGTAWVDVLGLSSKDHRESTLRSTRREAAATLERMKRTTQFSELSQAMVAHDESELSSLATDLETPAWRALALADLQFHACGAQRSARCEELTHRLRERAVAGTVMARAELRYARSLYDSGDSKRCVAALWHMLKRSSGLWTERQVLPALELMADCHALDRDREGLAHALRVASGIITDDEEFSELVEHTQAAARRHGLGELGHVGGVVP